MGPLRVRNYRLYFLGQIVSLPGTWLQVVAQAWLVIQLGGSGTDLGITVALQALPVLLLGSWGGAIADAVDRQRLLVATQAAQGVLALTLGILTISGVVTMWVVWLLAFGLGVARSVDSPARQAFVSELVDHRLLAHAISLNSTVVAAARMVGPAAAGAVIALVGIGVCFVINGASFIAVLIALLAMDRGALLTAGAEPERERGAVRAGLRYVRGEPGLLVPLLMMVIVGTLVYEFQVTIPLLAHETFGLGAAGMGALFATMGAGAVVTGLTLGPVVKPRVRTLAVAALAFAVALGGAALSPGPVLAGSFLLFAGGASVIFTSMTNATLQLRSAPAMRGRVIALYIVAFLGSTPIGGPLVGAIGEWAGARAALGVGAAGCLAAAGLALVMSGRLSRPVRAPAAGSAGGASAAEPSSGASLSPGR